MPAPSLAMRRLAGLALHHPSAVSAKNRSILKMSTEDLRDYAETPEEGLPEHVRQGKRLRGIGSRLR